MSHYAYQNRGVPILDWNRPSSRPPYPSQSADARSLGDYAPVRPGGPEPVGGYPGGRDRYFQGTLQGVGSYYGGRDRYFQGTLQGDDGLTIQLVSPAFLLGIAAGWFLHKYLK